MMFKEWLKKTITNGPDDEDSNARRMLDMFARATERNSLATFGVIGGTKMLSTPWPYGKVVFFMDGDQPVGYCILQRKDNWPDGPDKISMMFVSPQYRKRGIAMAFHEFLLGSGHTLQADDHMTIEMQRIWHKLIAKYQSEERDGKLFVKL